MCGAGDVERDGCQRNMHAASQLESEMQLSNAQVNANKSSMGTLTDLVLEKTEELHKHMTNQLQSLQLESTQRLNDMQLTLERLEFRFKHHVRDCQSIAEQTDLHHAALQNLRSQLGQTQNLLDKHREEQTLFADTIQYAVSSTESKTAAAMEECAKTAESFQQQMLAYIKRVEGDVQGALRAWRYPDVGKAFALSHSSIVWLLKDPMKVVTARLRDLEIKDKRQGALIHRVCSLHRSLIIAWKLVWLASPSTSRHELRSLDRQTFNDLAALRQGLRELAGLKTHILHQHEQYDQKHSQVRATLTELASCSLSFSRSELT